MPKPTADAKPDIIDESGRKHGKAEDWENGRPVLYRRRPVQRPGPEGCETSEEEELLPSNVRELIEETV